jgi:hypothetical protein
MKSGVLTSRPEIMKIVEMARVVAFELAGTGVVQCLQGIAYVFEVITEDEIVGLSMAGSQSFLNCLNRFRMGNNLKFIEPMLRLATSGCGHSFSSRTIRIDPRRRAIGLPAWICGAPPRSRSGP